jgi:hypothetical protein
VANYKPTKYNPKPNQTYTPPFCLEGTMGKQSIDRPQ